MSTIRLTVARESITSAKPALHPLLTILEHAYDHPSWHGANLRGSIRGLTPALAAWRPAPARHNIWELIVHAAYWKYVARVRMSTNRRRQKFPLAGHNWFERPAGPDVQGIRPQDRSRAHQLRADIALLDSEHRALLEFVRSLSPRLLHKKIGKSPYTCLSTIAGVAAHDVYHAGQIQLLKTLARVRRRT